jgi:hypothetical protein
LEQRIKTLEAERKQTPATPSVAAKPAGGPAAAYAKAAGTLSTPPSAGKP